MTFDSTKNSKSSESHRYVLQLCHGYGMPFHDVARQYAALFKGTQYKVITAFLTGEKSSEIASQVESDDVIFLENTSKDIRGLKLRQIRQVRELCKRYNFAFCIAHRFKPLYIATHVSDLFVIGVHHAFGGYDRWARRFYITRKQKNVALLGVSNAIRDDVRKRLPGFPVQRIQTLYNRIDVDSMRKEQIDKETAREKLKLPEDGYIFGNVGRLHPDKDQKTLIRAFALICHQLPSAYLVIMGKGRLEAELKMLAEELGVTDQVIFTGAVANAYTYFKAFDCFVLSSDHEPFGMVLLEAIAANIPILVSDSGGAPEICCRKELCFPLGDEHSLAAKMGDIPSMSRAQIMELASQQNDKLQKRFSFEAVKKVFWSFDWFSE